MSDYVIVEFVNDGKITSVQLAPQLVDADYVLTKIAKNLGLDWLDLSEQNGPSFSATSVWNARTEEMVAMYQPFKSLAEFM